MVSNCCGAPVNDPGNTGEGLCKECFEMSEDIYEENPIQEKCERIFTGDGRYYISNKGRVFSYCNGKRGTKVLPKLLITQYDNKGYLYIGIKVNGKRKQYKVHRLVAYAFIDRIEGKDFINHKNGIKDDNRVENLEWCNKSENEKHKYSVLGIIPNKIWKGKFGKDHNRSKCVNQYTIGGEFIKKWDSSMDIQRELNINNSQISGVCKGKRPTAGGYKRKHCTDEPEEEIEEIPLTPTESIDRQIEMFKDMMKTFKI